MPRRDEHQSGRVEGLSLARFIFACLVLVYHYGWKGSIEGSLIGPHGPTWLYVCRFAVQAFFVISGYVIILSAERRSASAFVIARAARLWPAMALCAAITALVLAPVVPWVGLSKALLLAPMLFDKGDYVDPSYWSLVFELRFYLGIAVLLAIFRRLPNLDMTCLVWLSLSYIAIGHHKLEVATLSPYSAFFIYGMLLRSSERGSRYSLLLILASLPLAALQIHSNLEELVTKYPEVPRTLPLSAMIAAAIFTSTWFMRRDLPGRLGAFADRILGPTAYPLYLIHQVAGFALINGIAPWIGFWPAVGVASAASLLVAGTICLGFEPWLQPAIKRFLTKIAAGIEFRFRSEALTDGRTRQP